MSNNEKLGYKFEAEYQAILSVKKAESDWVRTYEKFTKTVEPLPMEKFYAMLGILRAEVATFTFGYRRGYVGVKQGCWELCRKAATGESERFGYGVMDCIAFAKTYNQVVAKIGRAITSVLEECSDDGFSDFCDSFPLSGEVATRQALLTAPGARDGFLNDKEIRAAVGSNPPSFGKDKSVEAAEWDKLLSGGENYVRSHLDSSAMKLFEMSLMDRFHDEADEARDTTPYEERQTTEFYMKWELRERLDLG